MSVDSVRNPRTILKYFFISSNLILLLFIIFNLVLRLSLRIKMPKVLNLINRYFVLIFSGGLCFTLTLVGYFAPDNFVFSRLYIIYQHLGVLAFGSGLIAIINADSSWLRVNGKRFLFFSPLIILFSLGLIRLWPNDVFLKMVQEDHFIENTQFVTLVISSLVSFWIAFKSFKFNKILFALYLVAALGLFFVAGDEISWGQRIFHFSSEYVAENNAQGETNLHNLYIFNNLNGFIYMFVGLFGAFAWTILGKLKKVWSQIDFIIPQKQLFFYFFLGFIYNSYALLSVAFNIYYIGEWSEVAELMLDLGVLIFVLTILFRLKSDTKQL